MFVLLLAAGDDCTAKYIKNCFRAVLDGGGSVCTARAASNFDPEGIGEITEMRQYVFTEWDPTATSDMEALASVFDSNGDGELSGADRDDFRVMVTNADGTTTSHTLAELGITSINRTADATHIELPDGSMITGQSPFTWAGDGPGGLANATMDRVWAMIAGDVVKKSTASATVPICMVNKMDHKNNLLRFDQ